MDPKIEQQIQERLAELPEDIKAAMQSADLGAHIRAIAEKYKLHLDQAATLEDELYLVMLGFTHGDVFANNIEKNVKVSSEQSALIAQEIENTIFLPIRESMKAFAAQKLAPPVIIPSTPAAVTITPSTTAVPVPASQPAALTPAHMPEAEKMLTSPTVTTLTPPSATPPPKPTTYTADPYREPVE